MTGAPADCDGGPSDCGTVGNGKLWSHDGFDHRAGSDFLPSLSGKVITGL